MQGRSLFFFHVRFPGNQILKGNPMRNLLLGGTVGVALTIGAAGAAYANNPNVPTWSPLSINTNVGYPMYRHHSYRMSEHRAAYVKATPPDRPIFSNGSSEEEHLLTPDNDHSSANVPSGAMNEAPMADR
jgi:hypothetical protein